MKKDDLIRLLEDVKNDKISIDDAVLAMKEQPFTTEPLKTEFWPNTAVYTVTVADDGKVTITVSADATKKTGELVPPDPASPDGLYTIRNNRMFGDLVIEKPLSNWESSGPATFVFNVEAKLGGKTVYTSVASLSFSGAGTKSYTFTEVIPVGAVVTVTEVYDGSAYTAVGGTVKTVTVKYPTGDPTVAEDNPATVSFTNDYDKHERHGSGILNTFTKNGTQWNNSNDLTPATR